MKRKKIIGAILALTMIFSATVPTLAATDRDEPPIQVDGYIGFDPGTGPGTGPGGPTDPATVINITYSVGPVEWAATDATYNTGTGEYDIVSGSYTIENTSTTNVDLKVTLKSFTLTSGTLPAAGTLTLNTTGNLAESTIGQNIGDGSYTNTVAYSSKLNHGTTWTYGFGGSYSAGLPGTALTPVYDMVLNFAL